MTTKQELLSKQIIDRDGTGRNKMKQLPTGPEMTDQPLTVCDVLADAIYMMDSTRMMQSQKQTLEELPERMLGNYMLWKTLVDPELTLSLADIEALTGYLLAQAGSDCVKYQAYQVLQELKLLAPVVEKKEIKDAE